MSIDLLEFITQFHDHLAPRLDVYEQAVYLYIFRHSRLLGIEEVTIAFKSARTRMAAGVGENGKPMSENSAYKKLDSLRSKNCVDVLSSNHKGRLLRLKLPCEIPGILPTVASPEPLDLETMDFFEVPSNRNLLLEREGGRCFYTLQNLTADNFVVEHVRSRPEGDNGYRNCVAASREANNRKGSRPADDFLRALFVKAS